MYKLVARLEVAPKLLTSPLAYYESCLGLVRASKLELHEAEQQVTALFKQLNFEIVELTDVIGQIAVAAHTRFGKGRHKAALNMGDCFAYACAKVHRVPLLCKGDDFIHTDIELA